MSELQDASYQGMWRISFLLPIFSQLFPKITPHVPPNSPCNSVMKYAPHVLSAVNLVEYVPDTLMNSTSSSAMKLPPSKGGPKEHSRTLRPRIQRLPPLGKFLPQICHAHCMLAVLASMVDPLVVETWWSLLAPCGLLAGLNMTMQFARIASRARPSIHVGLILCAENQPHHHQNNHH